MWKKCVVLNCPTNKLKKTDKHVGLFTVPKDRALQAIWELNLPALSKLLDSNSAVCEEHFYDTDFVKSIKEIKSRGKMIESIQARLKNGAIPLPIVSKEDDFLSSYKAFQNAKSCELPCSCKASVADTSTEKCQSCIAKSKAMNSSQTKTLENENMKQSLLLKATYLKREDVVKEMISLGTSLNALGPDGRTALQVAIAKNHKDIIELLVENGADIHMETKFGKPFAYAASLGHTDLLDYFMKKGVDVNEKDQYGDTALHTMCKNRVHFDYKQSWSFLLQHGAHVNAENLQKKTPPYYLSRELRRIMSGTCSWKKLDSALNLMSEFLNRGVDLDDALIKQPRILPYAVMTNCEKLTEYLCQKNVDVNQDVPYSFSAIKLTPTAVTPLRLAVERQHLNVLKILVDHGAQIKYPDRLLHFCVHIGFVDGLKFFLEKGMDANMKDNSSNTPLHWVFFPCGTDKLLSKKKFEMYELLLDHGASLEQLNDYGGTPLQLASEKDLTEMIDLLAENGPHIGPEMKYRKLFDYAALAGHVTLMKSLLERGVDINKKNVRGETTLHFVCKNLNEKSQTVCTFLLSRGADVHAQDNDNETPIFYASQYLYKWFLSLHESYIWTSSYDKNMKTIKISVLRLHELITQGADASVALKECPILLHIAVRAGVKEVVECLLERNVDVNNRTKEGATALHCAAYFNRSILVPVLLRHGADINAIMPKKLTPLHVAVSRGLLHVSLMLINSGADIDAQDAWGQTVFHFAAANHQSEFFPSLLLREADTNIKDMHGLTVHDIVSDSPDNSTKQLKLSTDINAERKEILTDVFFKCKAYSIFRDRLYEVVKINFLSTYCTAPPAMECDAANWSSIVFRRCLSFMESRAKMLNMSEEQLTSIINENANPMDTELAEQVSLMRSREVLDGVTLYDIATKHFREMARFLGVTKIPDLDGFTRYGYYFLLRKRISAIERHWAGNELGKHLKVRLPDEIMDEIMKILNYRDVRNVLNATVGYEQMAFGSDADEMEDATEECGSLSSEWYSHDDTNSLYDDDEFFNEILLI